ncbi:hypothetical protein BC936DRAFT_136804 [Jimgerdemannia flammicorona]|uniref:Carbohydrate kinase PfkB domain-containing protein n=1 Tax=Jimgerdemannia flammicorona TaxID=994334 RepID=A0A433CYU5_9FUNG|nr:hypothetical protein BC936DRAFT_136804 [Jimgerdemannia flammicorona]
MATCLAFHFGDTKFQGENHMATPPGSPETLMIIGGIVFDTTATISSKAPSLSPTSFLNTSSPGTVRKSIGGVGRNLVETVWRLGVPVVFVSALGNDPETQELLRKNMRRMDLDMTDIERIQTGVNAIYNAVHDPTGQLLVAVADMNVFDQMDPHKVESKIRKHRPSIVAFDGNMSPNVMRTIALLCQELDIPAFFEPTSVPKSLKLFMYSEVILAGSVRYASPNEYELEAMSIEAAKQLSSDRNVPEMDRDLVNWDELPSYIHRFVPHAFHLVNYIPNLFVKLGEQGSLLVRKPAETISAPKYQYFKPEPLETKNILSVTGAGDSFVGTVLANLHTHRPSMSDDAVLNRIVCNAQRAAILTLKSDKAVSPNIEPSLLNIQ